MPTGDPGLNPLEYLPAPLTFVAGVLALGIWLVREARKLLAERNHDQSEQIESLQDKVSDLTTEVESLRREALAAAQAAHEERLQAEHAASGRELALTRENAELRLRLAQHGLDTDVVDPGPPGTK